MSPYFNFVPFQHVASKIDYLILNNVLPNLYLQSSKKLIYKAKEMIS